MVEAHGFTSDPEKMCDNLLIGRKSYNYRHDPIWSENGTGNDSVRYLRVILDPDLRGTAHVRYTGGKMLRIANGIAKSLKTNGNLQNFFSAAVAWFVILFAV